MPDVAKGLAGVVVENTEISDVSADGRLSYRGYDIADLVTRPFAEVAALVVSGHPGTSLETVLAQSANLTAAETALVLSADAGLHPMQLLEGVVPLLSRAEPLGFDEGDQGIHVAAKLPAVVATHLKRRAVELDPDSDYATRFLAAIGPSTERTTEAGPDARHVEAFNVAQILQLEHSFNAGTFAARVVASTLAPVEAAIASGIAALSGSLHGGADEAVLNVADTLGSVKAAQAYVDQTLAENGKIPGMGHREYRVRDPRAHYLQDWAERLSAGTEHERTFGVLRAIDERFSEQMQVRGKPLHANVEFYKGLVYRVLGLPNHFFTSGFAMARAFGYVAHFLESREDNRIYRPAAHYVGPMRSYSEAIAN